MTFLLDTNHCSMALLGDVRILKRLEALGNKTIAINAVTIGELVHMAEQSRDRVDIGYGRSRLCEAGTFERTSDRGLALRWSKVSSQWALNVTAILAPGIRAPSTLRSLQLGQSPIAQQSAQQFSANRDKHLQ